MKERIFKILGIAARMTFALLVAIASSLTGYAQQTALPPALRDVGIDQRLNEQAPLDLVFTNEAGEPVRLGDFFSNRPVILTLVYYECPMLCTQVLNGLTGSLKSLSFDIGNEFQVVTVSFDPKETAELAARKKQSYLGRYERPTAEYGWHFLTGDQESINRLTSAVGFRYSFDAQTNQFAHASGIMVLTPDGRISRYFYGIEYAPRDLKLALVESSGGKIGSPVDQVLLFCYHYDPTTGKYGLAVMNVIRAAGAVTIIGLIALIFIMKRRNLRTRARSSRPETAPNLGVLPVAIFLPFFPDSASTVAGDVDALYLFLVAVALFFSVLISGIIIYFAIRYRRRSDAEVGAPIKGSLRLEVAWSIIPFIISMVIFVWGAGVYFTMTRTPSEALEIYGIGKQWMWRFQHPDGQREINELHVPVGRNVKLTIATEDVIHSFFVPAFRTKADVVPGRLTKTWFKATRPGRYHLFCAEYCGTQHSGMIGWVVVLEPAEYQAWLSGSGEQTTLASSGEKLFNQFACNTCHRSDGRGRGPSLVGVFGSKVLLSDGRTITADDTYVRESVYEPQAKVVAGYDSVMPTFKGLISEEQLLQLIEYVKSLSSRTGESPAAPGPAAPGPAVAEPAAPKPGITKR